METLSIKRSLFGKEVEFILYDVDKFMAEPIIDLAYNEGLRLQKIFNFYDEKSELFILNKKRKLKVSKELLELLLKAIKFSKLNPEYDITKGKLFKARKEGKSDLQLACSYKDIVISSNIVTLAHEDVLIDLGSVAKGFIVDKMAQILIDSGIESGIVDGRGDMMIFCDNPEDKRIIGIQHPRKKDELLCSIKLNNQGVATSGDYNQYFKTFDKSHIINAGNLISVTVVAESATTADLFTTILFVSKEDNIISLLNQNKDIKVLTCDKNLKIKYYNGFEELINDEV
jgi:thiamine biosynthesis lipoprotein